MPIFKMLLLGQMAGTYFAPDESGGGDGSTTAAEIDELRKMVRERGLEIERLQDELREAQGRAVPEGATLLVGEDSEFWKQIRGLDIPTSQLTTMAQDNAHLKSEVARMEREEQLRNVAFYANWNPNVLIKLDRLDEKGRIYEVKEDPEGNPALLIREGEQGEPYDAREYALSAWPEFSRSLFMDDEQTTGAAATGNDQGTRLANNAGPSKVIISTNGNRGAQQVGTPFVRQPAGKQKKEEEPDIVGAAKSTLDRMYQRNANKQSA